MHPSTSQSDRKRVYRSIQYRSVSSDIKSNHITTAKQKISLSSIFKQHSLKNQPHKKAKQAFNFFQNNSLLNKSVELKFSFQNAKQKKCHPRHYKHESSILLGQNPEQSIQSNLKTSNYLETFEQLMEIQSKPTYLSKKMGPLSHKIKYLKDRSHVNRIILPTIIQYENSTFTALDPINLPIQNIHQSIKEINDQLIMIPTQIQSIRHSLKQIQNKNKNCLHQFELLFCQQMERIHEKLRQNLVIHQNHMLIAKRQMAQVSNYLPDYKNLFKESHQRLEQLQKVIFQTKPFELVYQKKQKAFNQNQQIISDAAQITQQNLTSLKHQNFNQQFSNYF